jgi:uncharacterized protein involved in exopolysaccharide biosynthesis
MSFLSRFNKSDGPYMGKSETSKLDKMAAKEAKKAARAAKRNAAFAAKSVKGSDSAYFESTSSYRAQAAAASSSMNDLTVGDYANGMPRIRVGEFLSSFGHQLRWVLPLFLIGTLAAWPLTKDFKRKYSGEGRVLVQLGDEYVYESVTSKQAQGLQLTPDHIVQNEVGIMKNADIIEQVVGEMTSPGSFGPQRFAKKAFKKINAARGPVDEQNAWVDLYKEVESSFVVAPKPKSSIVDLVYKHEDPEVAVETLNVFIQKYLDARKALFVEGSSDLISERRRATEDQLRANDRAIAKFLRSNGISDFDSERGGVTKRTEELRTQLNTLRGRMTETERALATVEEQLRSTPQQIDLYVDDRASQRIAQAELELKQLLAKYLPGSPPVRQKESELNQLKSILATQGGQASGGRRVGPNPVFQSTLTRRNTLQSQADSYREKEFTLQRQLDAADGKVRRLQDLSPQYQNLLRERETLDARLKNYTTKEQEALVNQEQAESSSENVQVISWATRPRKGPNMRLIIFALASAGWGFTLFILALMKVFLNPALYASNPSPANRRSDRRQESYGHGDFQPQPASAPQYYSPPIPESVPMPAAAFGAVPYAAPAVGGYETAAEPFTGAAGYAHGGVAQTAQPLNYAPAQASSETYAQAAVYAPASYGSAAPDMYANPYLQSDAAAQANAQPQSQPIAGGPDILGHVPTQQ